MWRRRACRGCFLSKRTENIPTVMLSSRNSKQTVRRDRVSNWTKILLPVFPSIVFGIFTVVFNQQQNAFFHENRNQERKQVEVQNKRMIFDNYIDVISDRILNPEFQRNNSDHLRTIRVKTLTALRHLDSHYKREIVLFLYDNNFIRSDIPANQRLNLDGADLSSIRFTRSSTYRCILTNLYLPGVFISNSIFEGCQLMSSVFSDSDFNGSRFIDCSLGQSDFKNSFMDRTHFATSDLDRINLVDARLTYTTFSHSFVQGLNLINTDLLGSDIIDSDLFITDIVKRKPNVVLNTRLPNGSFSETDSLQLVRDGGAEEECSSHDGLSAWDNLKGLSRWSVYRKNDTNSMEFPDPVKGNCYVKVHNTSTSYQHIMVKNYSALIASGKACCNVSAYVGCSRPDLNDAVNISVRFMNSKNLSFVEKSLVIDSLDKPFTYRTSQKNIPADTYMLSIRYTSTININSSVVVDDRRYCVVDEISLSIVHVNRKTGKCET